MRAIPARNFLSAAALVIVGFLPPISLQAQSSVPPDSSLTTTDTATAYVIADSVFVSVDESGRAQLRQHYIVRIKTADGAHYGNFRAIENSFTKLKQVSGYQFDADANILDSLVSKKSLVKVCGFGSELSLYLEDCSYIGAFKTAHVPYTVDWQATVELKSIGMWPGWTPDQRLFLKSGYCQIEAHPANMIRYNWVGEFSASNESQNPETNMRSWSVANLRANSPEPNEPWPLSRETRLYATPQVFKFAGTSFDGSSWNSLSKGCFNMTSGAFKSSNAQDDFFRQHQKTDSTTLLESMHRSLAGRLRYVAIYLGMGGWIPHPANETFQVGYGDCKDLATLYAVMFAKAGIETRISLISTRNQEFIDPGMPTISLFNHAIMFYTSDAETTWVDPTCFDCALGDLPYSDEGLSTLIVDSENGNLLTTPVSHISENVFRRNIDISLTPALSAMITLKSLLLGNPSHGVNTLITSGDRNKVTSLLASHLNISGVPGFDHNGINIAEKELSRIGLEIAWSSPRLLKQAGEDLILDLSGFRLISEVESTDLTKRKHPIDIGYPCQLIDTVRIILPPGYDFKSLPAEVNDTSRFGDLTVNSSLSADTAIIIRSLSRKQNIIEPEQFVAFQQYRKDITTRGRIVATLVKK